ncbi:sarcoplasmic reticulum histidine-rich calcium-binding protein-like [Oscarella lobularis]|uniref:sarcoplasmic reticulum histidine-rich calcium-binding protein-like n=1 Tax=Oscarella lobularis TaxID=121494 RepID=UPI00331369F8
MSASLRCLAVFLLLFSVGRFQEEGGTTASEQKPPTDADDKETPINEYAVGSVCQYCAYAKFCKLCEQDCPCETSRTKPNCKMCKYCRYCSVAGFCDTICKPGGILDTVTSTIWNALPSWNKAEVDKDIESIKSYL